MKHYINKQKGYSNKVPRDLWIKCPYCKANLYKKKILPYFECPNCHYDFQLKAMEKLKLYTKQFEPLDSNMEVSLKNIKFPNYKEKLSVAKKKTQLNDAILTGIGNIKGFKIAIGVLDPYFIMGSMGTVVGKKLVDLFDTASSKGLPVILLISSGGARMQEGIFSLMQMINVSDAVIRHSKKGLFYLSILSDPTMGGVSASFAFQADVVLAEPHARIGFAGPKIIKNVSSEEFPTDFQRAEYLMKHGLVDNIIRRSQQLDIIADLLKIHVK